MSNKSNNKTYNTRQPTEHIYTSNTEARKEYIAARKENPYLRHPYQGVRRFGPGSDEKLTGEETASLVDRLSNQQIQKKLDARYNAAVKHCPDYLQPKDGGGYKPVRYNPDVQPHNFGHSTICEAIGGDPGTYGREVFEDVWAKKVDLKPGGRWTKEKFTARPQTAGARLSAPKKVASYHASLPEYRPVTSMFRKSNASSELPQRPWQKLVSTNVAKQQERADALMGGGSAFKD
jgi:hypothetical protein